jgi:hypothetical protein
LVTTLENTGAIMYKITIEIESGKKDSDGFDLFDTYTAEIQANIEHISDVIEEFKKLLYVMGYPEQVVNEYLE